MAVTYQWRGEFENPELNALHAEAFDHPIRDDDWKRQVQGQSLGWVCARDRADLVGFVNVAWDGGTHAFTCERSTLTPAASRRRVPA